MIKLEDVHFRYPNGPDAIRGITLGIGRGEFIGIIGHSGAGKTTLAKLIAGLLKPTQGRVLIDGLDTRRVPASTLARKVGYVFQNPEMMIFSATIYEEVAFALRNMGLPNDEVTMRVQEALKVVDLNKPLDHSPHTLSFGEKRRLAIACILAMKPEVLILDEPTTGLDYSRSIALFEALSQLHKSGRTVIVITHDTDLLARFASRILVLREGVVVSDSAAEDVLSDVEFLKSQGFIPTQLQFLASKLRVGRPTVEAVAEAIVSRFKVRV
ncbi:MAG: ABC transporter ATP-binding protein [Thermofilaceae archaeon]